MEKIKNYKIENEKSNVLNYENISLIILAGGKSRRMGTPKEDLQINGLSFLDIQKNLGKEMGFTEIIISGIDVLDELEGRGPLSGIYSSLKATKTPLALVIPVDCIGITAVTLKNLLTHHFRSQSHPFKMAVTLLKQGPRPEPLIGVFSKDFSEIIYNHIKDGPAKIMAAICDVPFQVYETTEEDGYIVNINTKEDLEKITKKKS